MRSNHPLLRVALVILSLALLAVYLFWRMQHPSAGTASRSRPAPAPAGSSEDNSATMGRRLQDIAGLLKAAGGPTEAHDLLTEVNGLFIRAPRHQVKEAILRFLDTKADAPTRLGFALAPDGSLREAPSLRTFLLDHLTTLDPPAAAACAERVLAEKQSADEYAVALRTYALGSASGKPLLKQKVREMVAHEAWRESPSTGFLEAFDVIVHTRDIELTPTLAELMGNKDNRAVAHAAYLTLDRLVQLEPSTVLAQLLARPELMTGREATRANFFARADPSDPRQRTILEAYLLSPVLSPAELETFSGLYPNANFMVSHNLLTASITPDHETLAKRDSAALPVVRAWLADSRFANQRPQLAKIRDRLETFVQQSRKTR